MPAVWARAPYASCLPSEKGPPRGKQGKRLREPLKQQAGYKITHVLGTIASRKHYGGAIHYWCYWLPSLQKHEGEGSLHGNRVGSGGQWACASQGGAAWQLLLAHGLPWLNFFLEGWPRAKVNRSQAGAGVVAWWQGAFPPFLQGQEPPGRVTSPPGRIPDRLQSRAQIQGSSDHWSEHLEFLKK